MSKEKTDAIYIYGIRISPTYENYLIESRRYKWLTKDCSDDEHYCLTDETCNTIIVEEEK